jgi:tetraacyldisaccharide 4'-kinase
MTPFRTARPLLLPLVPVYRLGLAVRDLRLRLGWEPTRRLRHPVISIGNVSAGGSGKTPFAIELARLLKARGFRVDVLSRGYGRRSNVPALVRPDGTAEEFGDEPLLITREAGVPVYVAPQRYDAGSLAEQDPVGVRQGVSADFPSLHILDDGFQHRQLARDIDIVLLSQDDWHDRLLPAGNLREPLRAIVRADFVAIPTDQPELENGLKALGWAGPVWRFHRRMEVPPVNGSVAAFCGIARPAQFFAGLERTGLCLASRTIFRDHYQYSRKDIRELVSAGRRAGATAFLTTDKDKVRLGSLASEFPPELPLKTAGLRIEIEGAVEVLEGLKARLATSAVNASL